LTIIDGFISAPLGGFNRGGMTVISGNNAARGKRNALGNRGGSADQGAWGKRYLICDFRFSI